MDFWTLRYNLSLHKLYDVKPLFNASLIIFVYIKYYS